jgi:hypothetical protein
MQDAGCQRVLQDIMKYPTATAASLYATAVDRVQECTMPDFNNKNMGQGILDEFMPYGRVFAGLDASITPSDIDGALGVGCKGKQLVARETHQGPAPAVCARRRGQQQAAPATSASCGAIRPIEVP